LEVVGRAVRRRHAVELGGKVTSSIAAAGGLEESNDV